MIFHHQKDYNASSKIIDFRRFSSQIWWLEVKIQLLVTKRRFQEPSSDSRDYSWLSDWCNFYHQLLVTKNRYPKKWTGKSFFFEMGVGWFSMMHHPKIENLDNLKSQNLDIIKIKILHHRSTNHFVTILCAKRGWGYL